MKEKKLKAKAKKFWEEHKTHILLGGIVGVAVSGAGMYIFKKGYETGIIDGYCNGFEPALEWMDKEFPEESKAMELWNQFKELHPERVVSQKGLGKWSK